MSRYQEKSELPPLLLTRSDFRNPLDSLVVERPWVDAWSGRGQSFSELQMAQCNRVQRPPPPPHLIAQSKRSNHNSHVETVSLGLAVDPCVRVKQLEKSLVFVCENHSVVLQSLHREVEELKKKNRELQFQMIFGKNGSTEAEPSVTVDVLDDPTLDAQKKIEKLEKEVRRLRSALRESLKINSQLMVQVEVAKQEAIQPPTLVRKIQEDVPLKALSNLDLTDIDKRPSTPGALSPKVDEYSDSLHQIQQASSARTKLSRVNSYNTPSTEIKRIDYRGGRSEWHGERGRRYSEFQPRLPRLALRHQNYHQQQPQQEHHQFGPRGPAEMLPVLKKPLFPVLDQSDRPPRKPRGNRNRHGNNIPQR